jgi:hypothetical protein
MGTTPELAAQPVRNTNKDIAKTELDFITFLYLVLTEFRSIPEFFVIKNLIWHHQLSDMKE